MTISFKKTRKRLLANAKVRKEYDRLEPQFKLAEEMVAARTKAKLSQQDVARRMGTTQSVIAKIESGRAKPSTRSLERYAAAIGAQVDYHLVPCSG